MKISTRGRYALRVMVDIAEHSGGNYIALKEIASRQDISLKYLESIMTALSKAGLIEGAHGKGGGYRLNRAPDEYTLGDVLRITESDLAPVKCLEKGAESCPLADNCRTIAVWREFDKLINDFFDSKTLADLMNEEVINDYVI
ncbi:MAG: Rrf2 family transcriptional regulator [Ruminococcaceae bacterium]|jgi:Rrf2 family protein|nr:Rrf2 family transcriptional regulator [Oscillospiraceae bacterium]